MPFFFYHPGRCYRPPTITAHARSCAGNNSIVRPRPPTDFSALRHRHQATAFLLCLAWSWSYQDALLDLKSWHIFSAPHFYGCMRLIHVRSNDKCLNLALQFDRCGIICTPPMKDGREMREGAYWCHVPLGHLTLSVECTGQ